jgi:hypothetical protein
MGDKKRQRERLIAKFHEQDGLCHWCKLPMTLFGNPSSKFFATYDHLDVKYKTSGKNPIRKYVAAHRFCNNSRGHDPELSEKALRRIKKSYETEGLR